MDDKVNQALLRMLKKQKISQEAQEDQSRAWDLASASARGAAYVQAARIRSTCAADIAAEGSVTVIAKNPLVKQQLLRVAAQGFARYKAALLDEKAYADPAGSEVAGILKALNEKAFLGIPAAVTVAGTLLRGAFLTRYKEALTHAGEDQQHAAEKAEIAGFEPAG